MGSKLKSVTKAIFTQADNIPYAGGWGARICVLLMTILMTYEVVARYLFAKPTGFMDDLAALLMGGIVALGISYVMRVQGHVRVDVLFKYFPQRIQKWVNLFTSGVSLISCLLVSYYFLIEAIDNYQRGVVSMGTLHLKLWQPMVLVFAGFVLLALELVRDFYSTVRNISHRVEEQPR